MAQVDYTAIAATSIATPAAGVKTSFIDLDLIFKRKNPSGYVDSYQNQISTASQAPVAATRTYIVGIKFAVMSTKLQVGTMFRWRFNMTKTAAGAAASTFDIAVGTVGTTADVARVSFTKPAGTAVVDEGWVEINCIVRSVGVAGVLVGEFTLLHNGNTAGHATIPVVVVNTVSAGFDTTVANLFVGVCITTGSADAITIQMVTSEVWDI